MNTQRRTFVRNLGITALGLPLASNLAFSATSSEFSGLSTELSIVKKLKTNGFKLLEHQTFQLNDNCRAIPIVKEALLWSDERGLLVVMDTGKAFVLNEKQVKAYNDFISNLKQGLEEHNTFSNKTLADLATPKRIIETNNTKDFRFVNANNDLVEVRGFKKQAYVKIG